MLKISAYSYLYSYKFTSKTTFKVLITNKLFFYLYISDTFRQSTMFNLLNIKMFLWK